jgi:undecaprenyl-diphosphatase
VLVEFLKSVDDGAYYSLDHTARQIGRIEQAMRLGDSLGTYLGVAAVLLFALILLAVQRRWRAALGVLVAFVFGVALVETMRTLLPAPRPLVARRSVDAAEMMRSFPSSKVFLFTLAAVFLLFALWPISTRKSARALLTPGVVVLILWVAMSQLMLGLHFVTDVSAGLFGGIALALLASRFFPPTPREMKNEERTMKS